MCRVQDGVITNRPPRPARARRGKTADEDGKLEQELLADPKERGRAHHAGGSWPQ